MKVKCLTCGLEVEKTKEDIFEMNKLSKTGKIKPDKMLKLLDIYEGECLEGEEHAFSWDVEFRRKVEALKVKSRVLIEMVHQDEFELSNTKEMIKALELQIKDAEERKNCLETEIMNTKLEIPTIEEAFEEITGTKDFEEWK